MAETIAHSLMENLEELMSCKRDLIREEEDQIAWLYKDLQWLIAFLKDLPFKFKDHKGVKNLEARITDVVYEAETAVDLFIVNIVLDEEEDEDEDEEEDNMRKKTKLTKKIEEDEDEDEEVENMRNKMKLMMKIEEEEEEEEDKDEDEEMENMRKKMKKIEEEGEENMRKKMKLMKKIEEEEEEENRITKLMKKTGLGRSLNLGHVKKEIEVIKTEVKDMYDKRTYGVQTVNNVGKFSTDRDTSRATNSSKLEGEEKTMVGFEQETMILKEQLTGGLKQLKIISIVGMAGQGKTTLAARVYNDDLVTYYFPDMRAWITVSQEYQKKDLLLGLLSSVLHCTSAQISDTSDTSDEKLIERLYQSLKGRRYFIVMDDIWDHSAWFDLENCFPDDNNGSRIMFTSRHENVALLSKPMSFPPLSLRFLSPDESWNLLRHKIFQRESCPSELMEMGKKIGQKCQGLPLAIVVVAGILRNVKKSQERWKQVWKTLNSQMAKDQELWTKTIALSYNHLLPHLKPCFLYFAIFPEDFQILVRKLIWLWVAEGFIRKTGTKSLEDVAEEYLMDLIGRNLVFVSRRGYDGRIKACGIHDLLREFCLQKATEEYFLQRIIGKLFVSSSSSSKLSTPARKYTRSLFPFHDRRRRYHGYSHYRFKLLRVFHSSFSFRSCEIEIRLVLLRYLDLGWVTSQSLPASISNLWNLETLIVSPFGDSSFYLPRSIRKMVKLRHVSVTDGEVPTIDIESPDNLVDYPLFMDNLQTLSWVNPWSCTDVLARSPNLRKLGLLVSECGYIDGRLSLLPNLDFLNHVQELKVSSTRFVSRNSLVIAKFPPNLTKLTLKGTCLSSGDMSTLAKLLPNLKALKLSRDSLEGPCWEASVVFPKLKSLKFESHFIQRWVASSDDFPSLERLVFEQCPNLKKIPSEIGDILTLNTIELHRCKPSLAASAREIKEDQESQGNNGLQIKITKEIKEDQESQGNNGLQIKITKLIWQERRY